MTLQGRGPKDLTSLCLHEGAKLMVMTHPEMPERQAYRQLSENLLSGKALQCFKEMVAYQGGDVSYITHPEKFAKPAYKIHLKTRQAGIISAIDSYALGVAAMHLGAGRQTQDQSIDPAVGLILKVKSQDIVQVGDPLIDIYARTVPDEAFFDALFHSFVVE